MKAAAMLMTLLVPFGAWGAEIRPPAFTPVSLAVCGDMDPALVERLQAWAAENLALPVPLDPPLQLETDPESLDDVALMAAARLAPESLGVVVLLDIGKEFPHHGVYRPDLRVSVVNVRAMAEQAEDETYARRLERQVIRGICLLMGLDYSPNPESAMTWYSSLEELDQIGRNLDPPWLIRLQERAQELGIPIDPNSPYNMFRETSEE